MILPDNHYYEHPVFHPKRLRLKTQAMKDLSDEIHRWLWTGATGGLIVGAARVGKTTALLSLLSSLKTRAGITIPTYYVSIPKRDQKTIVSIFRHLCWSTGITFTTRARADHLSDSYVHHIADQAVQSDCWYAALFVDEMQHLHPNQINVFAELYDKLSLLEISLTVIFVGNDQESSHIIDQMESPSFAHIRGRFFTQGLRFRGLTSKDQVHACLTQYDTLHYPDNGPSYTGYFLSDDVKNGWKLSSLSRDLWRVYREYQSTYHLDSWGMQYFTATVNTLLSDFLPHHGVDLFDDDMVHECIRISGLVPSLVTAIQ